MYASTLEWIKIITKIRREILLLLLLSDIKMKKGRNLYFDGFPYRLLLMLVFFLLVSNIMYTPNNYSIGGSDAYGHLAEVPGAQSNVTSKSIGSYVVSFQRVPPSAQGSDNSTLLRFSVTQNSQDTYGVFAALIIKEKGSGNISAQFPYRFHEFGDIDFRYAFQKDVAHEVILQTRIPGDPQYQNNPLTASFDVPAITGGVIGTFIQIIVILVFIALPIGIVLLIRDFNKRTKRNSSTSK
jgi:hypothetical protein